MEGVMDAEAPLDHVAFQMSPSHNRYDAFVCGEGKTEKLASGLLEQLLLHLPVAKGFQLDGLNEKFILQLPEDRRGSLWFTKSTLTRFLHIIGEPESLKVAIAIEDEMSQLEEARNFHLSLYAQGQKNHSQLEGTENSCPKDMVPTPKPEVQTASSDATKNELLRAMDLRLTVLREELVTSFIRLIGAKCSITQVADLASFAQNFGAESLRIFLSKYLVLSQKNQGSNLNEQLTSYDLRDGNGLVTKSATEAVISVGSVKPSRNGVSPAKIAQAERQSSTESDASSNASDEDRSPVERSRPLIRSASPRRSASPMRRIQIGRSGSRRTTALTIKSLSYFPARERISSSRDGAANSSEDEESEQPPKKAENTARRMSVQDAINLFESKQRDQKTDIQKWRSSTETSITTSKSVLRRWSAGMGETSAQCPHENSEYSSPGQLSHSTIETTQENSVEIRESDTLGGSPDPAKTAEPDESLPVEEKTSSTLENSSDLVVSKAEEVNDRATASAEWNRQKEAELNQMLMKMLESKPAKYQKTTTGSAGKQDLSGEKRGGFYDHYKQKRDAKIRGENAGKRAEKEVQFKQMQQTLDQRKAEMTLKSKNKGVSGKQDSPHQSLKTRRNSTSTVVPKKEPSKPAAARKASPKASPLPAPRSSWPSTPSPRPIGPHLAKTPSGTSSSGTTPSRRKSQPTPSPIRASSRLERSEQQQKGILGSQTERKKSLKSQEEKNLQTLAKSGKSTKTKMTTSTDSSVSVPAKPSFYSKVTKKSSVVPLESKPFLRKGAGSGPGVGPVVKTKTSQSDESSKSSDNLLHAQENETIPGTEDMANQLLGDELEQPENDDADVELPVNDDKKCENTESSEQFSVEPDDGFTKVVEVPPEIQVEDDSGISPVAWVEIDNQELPLSRDNGPSQIAVPANVSSVAISSPRVRHSLSQMLRADSGEPDIIEWGNAENPPAMIYQKDSPKGLKRLLKFARKSKGEANVTGWASPSVFSEGEEDTEEPKAASKRNADTLMRKAALQAKGYGQQKNMFGESYDGGNLGKGSMSYTTSNELLSGQSNVNNFLSQVSHKLREGPNSAGSISTKASRSFFSLPTFRSSKSSETKLR